MSETDCLRVISEAGALGAKHLSFSGGEPLVWPHIGNVSAKACKDGMHVAIYTTGNVPKFTELASALHACGVKEMVFSLFGASPAPHESITRVPGSFQQTVDAIRTTLKLGLAAEIHFVPLTTNYTELEPLAKLAGKIGVKRISVLRFVPQGRGALLSRHVLSRLQNLELKRSIERLRKNGVEIRTGTPYNFLMLNNQPKCVSAINRLIVGPNLEIYPCDAFKQVKSADVVGTDKFSNLAQATLTACWEKSPYLEAVRTYLTTAFAKQCDACNSLEQCLSGCLAQKVIATGGLNKVPDPMCILKEG